MRVSVIQAADKMHKSFVRTFFKRAQGLGAAPRVAATSLNEVGQSAKYPLFVQSIPFTFDLLFVLFDKPCALAQGLSAFFCNNKKS